MSWLFFFTTYITYVYIQKTELKRQAIQKSRRVIKQVNKQTSEHGILF